MLTVNRCVGVDFPEASGTEGSSNMAGGADLRFSGQIGAIKSQVQRQGRTALKAEGRHSPAMPQEGGEARGHIST